MGEIDVLHEAAREIPMMEDYDVVVAGGGIAGAAAALAAARNGAKTALIEKQTVVGGLATLGLVAIYLPLCDGRGNQVIGGIAEELLKESIRYGPGQIPPAWLPEGNPEERKNTRYQLEFNPASFAISLEELLLDHGGVQLLYDSRVCALSMQEETIRHLVVENKSGRVAIGCKAVVDATGDADVCFQAGETTESLASNRKSGWFYDFDGQKSNLHMLSDPLYAAVPEGSRTYRGDDYRDVSQNCIDARRMILDKLRALCAADNNPARYPLLIPNLPQLRMTRRLIGQYELQPEDEGKSFEDVVCSTGDWRKSGPVYRIPFSCLHGKTANLLAAGRCISARGDTWDVIRAIPACAATGEAAGTAAALLVKQGANRVDDLEIQALQQQLRQQGVLL